MRITRVKHSTTKYKNPLYCTCTITTVIREITITKIVQNDTTGRLHATHRMCTGTTKRIKYLILGPRISGLHDFK